jgi:hypothetical protein
MKGNGNVFQLLGTLVHKEFIIYTWVHGHSVDEVSIISKHWLQYINKYHEYFMKKMQRMKKKIFSKRLKTFIFKLISNWQHPDNERFMGNRNKGTSTVF